MSEDLVRRLIQVLDEEPGRTAVRIELAETLIHLGRYDECLDQVRAVLEGSPDDSRALGIGALACELAGDVEGGAAYAANLRSHDGALASAAEPVTQSSVNVTVPLLSLGDVEGCVEEKRRLSTMLLRSWRLRKDHPNEVPTGVLLYGPEGSGKAHLAHALAGELHLNLVKLNVVQAVDPWGAALPGAIRRAHDLAMQHAPAMLFLDDIEAVTHRRLRFTPSGREALNELQDVLECNDPTKVLIVGSTSAPWLVNPALRGVGRLSTSLLVSPPDTAGRELLLERIIRQRLLLTSADLATVATRTEGCTSVDLGVLCSAAAELAHRESVDRGMVVAIDDQHFQRAIGSLQRSGRTWFDTAYNFAEFTDDSSEYDPLFDYIRRNIRRLC